jgi:type I site-specific restriction-modification system R (restriction) subunit
VQLTTRYQRDIPELFKFNAFCVISDGVNSKCGSFFAKYEFWYAWRRSGSDKAPALSTTSQKDRAGALSLPGASPKDAQGINSLYTMIQGLFHQTRLLDVIRNFIYLPDTSRKEEKILCRYPQYYAATKLYRNILLHRKLPGNDGAPAPSSEQNNAAGATFPQRDGKGGTYFGATGCGKSFTMLFLARLLMRSVDLASPTIVLITDRTDLDDQLSGTFTNAKGYIGDESIISVESREHLRELLKGRNSGGVFLTTIHKFTEDTELLTERSNVICISDEAHRSQVNLDQKVKVTDDGVKRTFGFAKYLHDSLPNATYVGFTGTPIDATLDVFGEVVDSYTMTESVADEITVPIVYEGRAAKVILDNSKLEEIENYYDQCAEAGASDYAIEDSKKTMANMGAILGDPQRIEALAADFVEHYEKRVSEGSTVAGKAIFVSSSRQIAYDFYKQVIKLLGERSSSCVSLKMDGAGAPSLPDYAKDFTSSFGVPEEWHKRNLPHRDKKGLVQSITFRLEDGLPKDLLKEIEAKFANLPEDQKKLELRKQYQDQLDQGHGSCALKDRGLAEIVFEALKHHDGEKYDLLAWSIMPNHVHVVIRAHEELPKIIQSWKSFTGKIALKRKSLYGIAPDAKQFWQAEYWDRFIRNEEHFNQAIRYVLENPSKAGLGEESTAQWFTGHALADRTKQELHPSQIKMVMTRGKDDEKALYDLLGNKDERKKFDTQFKKAESNFKIAIVVDMWLTGFDVPFLDTIYIDKPVQRHNLIQTISRVNRKFENKKKGLVVDYIGIKKQMNLALAHYSKADQGNIEEIEASIIVVRDHLDLLGRIFHQFDTKPYFSGSPVEQLECLNQAAEFVQLTDKIEKRVMFLVKRLKAAYDICSGSDAFTKAERDHIHFYLAVRSIVAKLTKGEAPDSAQMNAKVREMISEALQADGVEEIFKLGENSAAEIDIFGDDYLAKLEKVKLPNTKIKLLQQLLKRAIEDFQKVNKIKAIDFTKQFQALVNKYNERDEQDVLVSNVLDDFAGEIVDLFHALKKEKESFGELGIDFEEKAFYDILKTLAHKYDFTYPEDKLIALAKEVKTVVDDKAKYTDWSQRADIKAELKVDLILLLGKHGYPPVDRDEVYKEIFEQAENFKKYKGA